MGIHTSIPDIQEHDKRLGFLYFYHKLDSSKRYHKLADDKLIEKFSKIIDDDPDNIVKIEVYRTPLTDIQPTHMILYHAYVVIETENWYYSIETSEKNITMQRSKEKSMVRDQIVGQKRKTLQDEDKPDCIVSANGSGTILEVVKYLYKEDRLNCEYHPLFENCKDLSKLIFDKFNSDGKVYELIFTNY